MKKVFRSLEVHWGGVEGARDLVVGYLDFDGQEWSFQYADGLEGGDRLGFEGFQGLPRQAADAAPTRSPRLFPAFSARIPNLRRADVVRSSGDLTSLPREEAFYEFLRRSGGRTGTDEIWFTEVTGRGPRESEGLGKALRNEIRKMVSAIRDVLNEDIGVQLEGTFRILRDGQILDAETVVPEKRRDRGAIESAIRHQIAAGRTAKEAVERFTRETGFTCLNRLAALKMMEARGLIQESVSKGRESSGFRLFRRICEEVCASQADGGYRRYLELLFDDTAVELRVLFDRTLPYSRIFPRPDALNQAITLLNESCPAEVWKSDETIGWIYQYFTPKEDREALRDPKQGGSPAPRNSYELAVRNQFYTPRYVVEFLTDNTLGRDWYEMRKGQTRLAEICQYLVRRPNETFLAPGETPPVLPTGSELSQEELLRQPVIVPHRAIKDPRDIRILDPACGSGHFLLYAFDLLLVIYEEAWADPTVAAFTEGGRSLREDYPEIGTLRQDIPGLILRHNLHGIDIDVRATQIAALALWLRAQKTYQELGLKASERPLIRRSSIICAEPMPGDRALLDEFLAGLQPPVIRQLVRVVFEKMELAGEAGSLLKIEDEVAGAVAEARRQWAGSTQAEQTLLWPEAKRPKPQEGMLFDTSGVSEETFWNDAEERVIDGLKKYARHAENGHGVARHLFAEDAAQGFAFVDTYRKRFDVVLMNPPFGAATAATEHLLDEDKDYADWTGNILCAFISRSLGLLHAGGLIGTVYDRTANIKTTYENFRRRYFLGQHSLRLVLDLGWNTLDANVEVSASVVRRGPPSEAETAWGCDLTDIRVDDRPNELLTQTADLERPRRGRLSKIIPIETLAKLPNAVIGYYFPDFVIRMFASYQGMASRGIRAFQGHTIKADRYFRYWWEVPSAPSHSGPWARLYNGGPYSRYYYPHSDMTYYGDRASAIASHPSTILRNLELQQQPGLAFGKRGDFIDAQLLRAGFVSTVEGQACVLAGEYEAYVGLALLNSHVFQYVINMYCGQHKYAGYVNIFPVPELHHQALSEAAKAAKCIVELKESCASTDETAPLFFRCFPYSGAVSLSDCVGLFSRAEGEVRSLEEALNRMVFEAYGLEQAERELIETYCASEPRDSVWFDESVVDRSSALPAVARRLLSGCVGYAFGRWDIRASTEDLVAPRTAGEFGQLPGCPPGMLMGANGVPAESGRIASVDWLRARPDANTAPPEGTVKRAVIGDEEYLIPNIPWDGILVDDEGHPSDIVERVRHVLRVLWGEKADEVERELCDILRVGDLRTYFRNPRSFFEDHIRRYSKSRRKAPIYWLLRSAERSYGVWLYYQRLTGDTLFHLLRNYVEPKIEHEQRRRHELRRLYEAAKQAKTGAEERRLARDVDTQEILVGELADFKAKIEAAAYGRLPGAEEGCPGWDPDLNDGVILNIAPLHGVVPWKEAAKTWEELAEGRYEWSHVALRFWPKRVDAKCREDHSIALAHGREAR